LQALLKHAESRGESAVLVLACDLPFVTRESIQRLVDHSSKRDAIASRTDDLWQPLAARYRTQPALAATRDAIRDGERSLQAVLERLDVEAIVIDPRELRDWDTPEDQRQDTSTGDPSSG
jgi:molybdopterin-guanine dinucleotide biosynthesis protein A